MTMKLCYVLFLCLNFDLSNQRVVKLKAGDIEAIVLDSDDAWLVSLQDSMKRAEKIELENRGLFRVGHMTKDEYSKDDQKVEIGDNIEFLMFPYGTESKKRGLRKTTSQKQAVKLVLEDIPDHTVKLPNEIEGKNEKMRGFFQEAYTTTPTRFPIAYFTDSTKVPVEMKVLALKYGSLFSFGVVYRPGLDTQRTYGIKELPFFTAFVVDQLKATQPRIKKIQYINELNGPLKYATMVRFLYLLHKYHFSELPLAKVNKVEIDLDAAFYDDLRRFSDVYMKYPIPVPGDKDEL